jgi:acetylornithine deacetylase/succinyl-diaminopimelate desuccinylase-like protein
VFPSPFQLVTQRITAESIALTLPEVATASCHVTFPPPVSAAGLQRLLDQWTREFAGRRGLDGRYELVWGFAAEPVEACAGDIARVLARVANDLGMTVPSLAPSTGPSDLRHFADAGIPGLLYGPGRGYNAHRPDEHYRLDDLPAMICLFVELAAAWCGCAALA